VAAKSDRLDELFAKISTFLRLAHHPHTATKADGMIHVQAGEPMLAEFFAAWGAIGCALCGLTDVDATSDECEHLDTLTTTFEAIGGAIHQLPNAPAFPAVVLDNIERARDKLIFIRDLAPKDDETAALETLRSIGKPSLALAVLFTEPDISPDDLARRIGVRRTTLYSRSEEWRPVRDTLTARSGRDDLPVGTVDADGNVDAEAEHGELHPAGDD